MDEERGGRHCEDALSGLPSQHKRLCTQRSPKMTSFQEGGGYLSLFMEKETSVLCSSNNLATSPPSVKSSRNPPLSLYPPIIPSSTSSTTPHPNPSIPLVTSSRPDRHQRAGNIGILCHRFCSYRFPGERRNNRIQNLVCSFPVVVTSNLISKYPFEKCHILK